MYKYIENFVIRTPFFPQQSLLDFLKDGKISNEQVYRLIANDKFMSGIFLASPILWKELTNIYYNRGKKTDIPQKLKLTVLKYLIRISVRCTPFGIFAGCSTGKIEKKTDISFHREADFKIHTTVDSYLLHDFISYLKKAETFNNVIKYYPNNSIISINSTIRYLEFKQDSRVRTYSVSEVFATEIIEKTISFSKTGKTHKELVDFLCMDPDIEPQDANDFVMLMVDSQLLIDNFEPTVTGHDYLERELRLLSETVGCEADFQVLNDIKNLLCKTRIKPSNLPELRDQVLSKMRKTGFETEKEIVLHCNHIKPLKGKSLSVELMNEISRGLDVLNMFRHIKQDALLLEFKRKFLARYDQQEVPLLVALDSEFGIGFGKISSSDIIECPLISDLKLPTKKNSEQNIILSEGTKYLVSKIENATKKGERVIEINKTELIDIDHVPVEQNLTLIANIYNDKKTYNQIVSIERVNSFSGTDVLTRFCSGNPEIEKITRKIFNDQAVNNEKIVSAEIVYLPHPRLVNLIKRPLLCEYEIAYMTNPSVQEQYVIHPDDIMVRVENDKIKLRSRRLAKDILPRLSTAHNFNNSTLSFYLFLSKLQFQENLYSLNIETATLFEIFDHIPRIQFGNIILHKEKWKVQSGEIENILDEKNIGEKKKKLKKWIRNRKIPRYVCLEDGENELVIDFEHEDMLILFFNEVKGRKTFYLAEFLYSEYEGIVHDETKHSYCNEFILTFSNEKEA